VQAPASMQTEEVLVAAKELNFGAEVVDGDIS
jgi:Flp pilus assembly protein CpaB